MSNLIGRLTSATTRPKRGFILMAVMTWVVYGACLLAGTILKRGPVWCPVNHFVPLADAFLHGRLGLTPEQAAPLTEVVPFNGGLYVVYPPMPAIVLMPLVALFGTALLTNCVSVFVAGLAVGAAYLMLMRMKFAPSVCCWTAALFALGTNFWYISLSGSSWFFAHVVCSFFFFWATAEAFGGRRVFLAGLLLGAAALARLPAVLATPFLAFAAAQQADGWRDRAWRASQVFLGVAIFIGANMLYNYARYGTIGNKGYALIPGILQEPWYAKGIIHPSYLPRNLYAVIFQPPVLEDHFPYFVPSLFGTGIFFTTPAFLLMFLAPGKRLLTWIAVGGAIATLLPALLHGWPGGNQFGYRFALDAAPFLVILLALGLGERVSTRAKMLIGLSVLCSLWGLRYTTGISVQWIFPLGPQWRTAH